MSFFILADQSRPKLVERLPAVQTLGLANDEMTHGRWSCRFFGNLSGSVPSLYQSDGETLAGVAGILLFEGQPAPACLPALLEAFDPETFDWQGLVGTHAVALKKNNTLHLFTDGLGASRIYSNAARTVFSNSFLAMCELVEPRRFDIQACYEYVTAGSVYGDKTLVEEITALPANSILSIDAAGEIQITQRPSPIRNEPLDVAPEIDAIADALCEQLDKVFEPIARNYGDKLRLSFSGGFDSRLMLAMLLKHDARPSLFVYGKDDDEDVRIARHICKAEGLPLSCIDKSQMPPVTPDEFIGETEKNLAAFDGWKVETGLFDFGADREDRLSRHIDGQVPLNGGLGEIYRNFFYMPDRPSSTGAVISTFYSRYDPAALTSRFDEQRFRAGMAQAMREAIGADSDRLTRAQVESLYPKFRGRFWTGRDASNNQRFGPMFFPYLEHAAISHTARVPLRFKDLGYLQGRMISRTNRKLAGYPSDYGFALDGPRPLKYRLKTLLGTYRPPALRKQSFRLTQRTQQPRTGPLSDRYLSRVIDLEFPLMRQLFHIDRINCATQYALIATLEYLGQRFDLDIGDD